MYDQFTQQELVYLAMYCRGAAREALAKADGEIGTRKDPHLATVKGALDLERKCNEFAAAAAAAWRPPRAEPPAPIAELPCTLPERFSNRPRLRAYGLPGRQLSALPSPKSGR
jgi:hypothetical protein